MSLISCEPIQPKFSACNFNQNAHDNNSSDIVYPDGEGGRVRLSTVTAYVSSSLTRYQRVPSIKKYPLPINDLIPDSQQRAASVICSQIPYGRPV